jgi:predicted nuclease of predicted toxin-antitoxin system
VKFKLDENLPASAASKLTDAGDNVDTVVDKNLAGAPNPDVVSAATTAGRILISVSGEPYDSAAAFCMIAKCCLNELSPAATRTQRLHGV